MLKPKYIGNDLILTYVTDEQGKINLNVTCPVGCGRCCGYWRGVTELASWAETDKKRCPHWKSYGCRLERKKRPLECKAYICELALLAIENLLSQKDIESCLAKKAQDIAFTFFKRYPKIHNVKISDLSLDEKDRKALEKIKNPFFFTI